MEKKNLTVIVAPTDTASTDNTTLGSDVAGIAHMYSAETNISFDDGSLNIAEMTSGFYIAVQNSDGSYTKTDTIMPRNISMITEVDPVDAVGQRTTISAIDNIDCETEYCVTLTYNSPEIAKNYGYQAMKQTYSYVTRCCGTACGCPDGAAWDVLMGLAEQLDNDTGSLKNNTDATATTIRAALVRNSTTVLTAATYDNDEDWLLTKGSNIINCTTSCEYNSTTVAVGDFIGLPDTGAAGTIAANNATYYRVEAVDTTALTITLDRAWHLPTVTITEDLSDLQVLPKATGEGYADSTWSLAIDFADANDDSGIVTNSGAGSVMWTRPYVVDASIGLGCNLDCNATVTATTDAVQPAGHGYSIIQKELWANKGANAKKFGPYSGTDIYNRPVSAEDYFATTTEEYVQFIFDWVDTSPSAATDSNMPRPKRCIVAIPDGGSNAEPEWTAFAQALQDNFGVPFRQVQV